MINLYLHQIPDHLKEYFEPVEMKNIHPTVKPLTLCDYFVNLVTPPGGTILDPFMGSGTTGIAAVRNGFQFIGIEMNEDYFKISENRIKD